MDGLTVIFPFQGMSKISVSPGLLKSRILIVSVAILHVVLLLSMKMHWLGINLTSVIPCLGVS